MVESPSDASVQGAADTGRGSASMRGHWKLRVQSSGVEVPALADATVLDALLQCGIDYPHGCTTGLCSLCKSRLVSGEIEHLDYYESALSAQERAAGLFLPCSSRPRADCVVSPVQQDALMPPVQLLAGRVSAVQHLTHDILRIEVAPDGSERFDFLPGQYAQVAFGDHPARDFSMASLPGAGTIDFFVRKVVDGRVTGGIEQAAAIGTTVRIKGPYGTAYLREAHLGPIIAVAGGSGLAPVRSIVRAALDRGMPQPVKVYLGVRSEADIYLEDEFALLAARHANLSFSIVLSEGAAQSGRQEGFVHQAVRRDLAGLALHDAIAYVAGPPVMVSAVAHALAEAHLPASSCHTDPFLTEADRVRPRTA